MYGEVSHCQSLATDRSGGYGAELGDLRLQDVLRQVVVCDLKTVTRLEKNVCVCVCVSVCVFMY